MLEIIPKAVLTRDSSAIATMEKIVVLFNWRLKLCQISEVDCHHETSLTIVG